MRPLVEQYLASLPSIEREETWRDVGIRHVEGLRCRGTVHAGVEPQSQNVASISPARSSYEREQRRHRRSAPWGSCCRTRLRDVLREDLGGTYGVGVGAS